jgi:hypothetical protein
MAYFPFVDWIIERVNPTFQPPAPQLKGEIIENTRQIQEETRGSGDGS